MACDAPLSIKYKQPIPDGKGGWIYYFPADCGKCIKCLIKRKAQWSYRMVEQMNASFSAYFVTLTYDDQHLTRTDTGNTINPFDHKQFIENLKEYEKPEMLDYRPYSAEEILRKYNGIQEDGKLAYYGVSEYGGKTGRSHWHYILFNVRDTSSISMSWRMGRIQIDQCNINTIDYCLKYMVKDHEGYDYENRIKEKSYMSKGLGLPAMTKNLLTHIKTPEGNMVLNQRGQRVALPRYYRKKFLTDDERREKGKYISNEVSAQQEEKRAKIQRQKRNPDLVEKQAKDIRRHILKTVQKRNIE